MFHRITILFLLFFVSGNTFAYTDEELKKEVKILLARIKAEHVHPREINSDFAHAVNVNFMEYLDPDNLIFSIQDEKEFLSKETDLLADLKSETLSYYRFVFTRYQERLSAMTKVCEEVYGSKIPNGSTIKPIEIGKVRYESAQQNNLWKQYFVTQHYERLLDQLKDNEVEFPKDSLQPWSERTREGLKKRTVDFFAELQKEESMSYLFLNAIAQSFDPHTFFFNPESKKNFEEELTSEREIYGISLELDMANETHISNLAPGGPAWLSNEVHVGDRLLKISFLGDKRIVLDGLESYNLVMETFGKTKSKEIELVLETKDKAEKIVYLKKSKVYSDEDIIKNAVLEGEKKIGYIALPDFYVNWTDTSSLGCANDLAKCILKLKKDTIAGLILDLRGNGGGSLKEAIDIAGIFIDYGPVLATKENDGTVQLLKDFNRGSMYSGPLMVMIDEMSASASEIVASTLQDYNRAVIFGTPSYGKATSQVIYALDPKIYTLGFIVEDKSLGYANITNGQLYRVTGKWNQLGGVQPDVKWNLIANSDSEEGERQLRNVLIPDSITKKITFQPASKINTEQLNTLSQARMNSNSTFVGYGKWLEIIRAKEKQFEQAPTTLNLDQMLKMRNELLALSTQLKDYQNQLICNFTPSANHFDRDLIASDEILEMYNKQFLEQLKLDVQLMEGFYIMNDLINNR